MKRFILICALLPSVLLAQDCKQITSKQASGGTDYEAPGTAVKFSKSVYTDGSPDIYILVLTIPKGNETELTKMASVFFEDGTIIDFKTDWVFKVKENLVATLTINKADLDKFKSRKITKVRVSTQDYVLPPADQQKYLKLFNCLASA